MNNLLKNVGIWLVIGLVVLTVVRQFDTRQTTKDSVPYSEFMDKAKAGTVGACQQADRQRRHAGRTATLYDSQRLRRR